MQQKMSNWKYRIDIVILLERKTRFQKFWTLKINTWRWTKLPKDYRPLVKFRIMKFLFLLSKMCLSGHTGCLPHIHLLPFFLANRTPLLIQHWPSLAQKMSLASDWFRDGHVTQFWPFICEGNSVGGEALLGKFCFWKGT